MDFERNHPIAVCALSLLVWVGASVVTLWPFSWQRFRDRFPFILSIANLSLELAVMDLPKAFRGLFEVFLGHSIYEMRFAKSGNIETGWQWINRWEGDVGSLFFWGIVLGGIWGLINLIRGRARVTSGVAFAVAFLIGVYRSFFLSAL
jgi:hypothetical protein